MKKSTVLLLSGIAITSILCSFQILSRQSCGSSTNPKGQSTLSSGGIDGAAASPKDIINWGGTGYCADCHGASSTGVSITINASPSLAGGYVPGQVYNMSVTVAKSGINYYGYNFEVQTASNTNAGDFAVTNAVNTRTFNTLGTLNMSHKTPSNGTNGYTFTFNWIAPLTSVGTVTMYAAGVAANLNGQDTGDFVAKTSMSVAAAPTGINEISNDHSLKMYPSPASDQFTIELKNGVSQNAVVKLFNIEGKEINNLSYAFNGNSIRVVLPTSLEKGVYFVKVIDNGKILSQKLITQ